MQELRSTFPGPDELPEATINFVVTGAPAEVAADGTAEAALDTSTGIPRLTLGHHAAPDVIVTADYEVARALLAGGDPATVMSAFLGGQVLIQGEMIKLLALFGTLAADQHAAEVAALITSITA